MADIPEQHGLNWLIQQSSSRVVEVAVDDEAILLDLDTPADYDRLQRRWTQPSTG